MTGQERHEGPRGAPQALTAPLERAGLRYQVHHTAAGVAWAGLRMHVGRGTLAPYGLEDVAAEDFAADARAIAVAVQRRGPVLQLTAQSLVPGGPPDLDWLQAVNEAWRVGRVAWSEAAGYEASISLYAGERAEAPGARAIEQALGALRDLGAYLAARGGDGAGSGSPSDELKRVLDAIDGVVPEAAAGASANDLQVALDQLGLTFQRGGDGRLLLRLVEADGHDVLLELQELEQRFLCLRARNATMTFAGDAAARGRLQSLSRQLFVGTLAVAGAPAGLHHFAALPLAWLPGGRPDAALVSWLLDHAVAALATAARTAGAPG